MSNYRDMGKQRFSSEESNNIKQHKAVSVSQMTGTCLCNEISIFGPQGDSKLIWPVQFMAYS